MGTPAKVQESRSPIAGLLLWLTLCACAWVYWPGLDGPALLDDAVNLRVIESLDEGDAYLRDIVLGNYSGPTGRPLSMLSFGVERVYSAPSLRTLKFHNLLLHLLNGCLVVWLAVRLLPLFAGGPVSAAWAVLAGALWMLTPLFVSTVLYVVQRMAQLSALFCLLGLLCYVVGREQLERGARRGWLLIAAVAPCAAAAVLAKENGALLLPLIVLTECAVWRWQVQSNGAMTRRLRQLHCGCALAGAVAVLAYAGAGSGSLFDAYSRREFSLTERLLTQSRVLWEYLHLLVVPQREGLGVFHDDYLVSTGLLQPWTTLPAMLGLVVVFVLSVWGLVVRRSAVAWGVLFFLCAHLLESTILPLEIYFEHRNYLPALGIYVGLAYLLCMAGRKYPWSAPICSCAIAVWLGIATVQTGLQATVWSREIALLLDAAAAHPESPRLQTNLSLAFARMGSADMAMRYAARAEALDQPGRLRHAVRRLALLCAANAAIDEAGMQEVSARISSSELRDAGVSEAMQVLVERVNREQCPRFDARAVSAAFSKRLLIDRDVVAAPNVYGALAVLEYYLGNHRNANAYLELWLQRDGDAVVAWLIRLSLSSVSPDTVSGEQALRELKRLKCIGRVSLEQQDDIELLEPGWIEGSRCGALP